MSVKELLAQAAPAGLTKLTREGLCQRLTCANEPKVTPALLEFRDLVLRCRNFCIGSIASPAVTLANHPTTDVVGKLPADQQDR
jgi:hypothetical protein